MESLITPQGGVYFAAHRLELHDLEAMPLPITNSTRHYGPGPPLPDHPELELHWPGIRPPDKVGPAPSRQQQMTAHFIGRVVEVLDGRRSPLQLQRRFRGTAYAALRTRAQYARPGPPSRVLSVHAFKPTRSVIEVNATVERASRVGALVCRLEHARTQGWLCSLLRTVERPSIEPERVPSPINRTVR